MIKIIRNDLLKQKGNIQLNVDIDEILNKINTKEILDLIVEIYLEYIESNDCLHE
jgi:hypothetical protein